MEGNSPTKLGADTKRGISQWMQHWAGEEGRGRFPNKVNIDNKCQCSAQGEGVPLLFSDPDSCSTDVVALCELYLATAGSIIALLSLYQTQKFRVSRHSIKMDL